MKTHQISLNFPEQLHKSLKKYAKANGKTVADTIFSACEIFLDAHTPGLCPNCHTQNLTDADYCIKCNTPLTAEAVQILNKQINNILEMKAKQFKEEHLKK